MEDERKIKWLMKARPKVKRLQGQLKSVNADCISRPWGGKVGMANDPEG